MAAVTEDWDFYFCNVDDKLASIFMDLGALKMLPVETHPLMAYVSVQMRDPREDGLSSSEEYDRLVAIEDALEKLCADDTVLYVGRCTSNGCRDFYFYTRKNVVWQERVDGCMRAFPDYEYRMGSREDGPWSTYRSFLYPSDTNLQSIQNRRVCSALERHGDALLAARDIDHWAYFDDTAQRDLFVAGAAKLGFSVRGLTARGDDGKYGAQVFRNDVPSPHGIDEVTLPLYSLALECGGSYDGWECAFVRAESGTEAAIKMGSAAEAGLAARFKKMCRSLIGLRN